MAKPSIVDIAKRADVGVGTAVPRQLRIRPELIIRASSGAKR